jgi:hypothetical protein
MSVAMRRRFVGNVFRWLKGYLQMEPDIRKKARTAALQEEIASIHLLNRLYWERADAATSDARAAYHCRLGRLEEIRAELDGSRLRQVA